MARKAEAPKGEAFLPGTSAAELREMAKRADNGIDSIRYMAMYMRHGHNVLGVFSSGLGTTDSVTMLIDPQKRQQNAAIP